MQSKNISDVIEHYLKTMLAGKSAVEIKRSQLAAQFDCVPSQINYVIKTRFTIENGYNVSSKRGGGGYIRIVKLELGADAAIYEALLSTVAGAVSLKQAHDLLNSMQIDGWLTAAEACLLKTVISDEALASLPLKQRQLIRGQILTQMLQRLRFFDRK